MHLLEPANLFRARQNTFHPRPTLYIPGCPCIPSSRLILLAAGLAAPCTSAAPVPVLRFQSRRAPQPHSATSRPPVCRQTTPHPAGTLRLRAARTQSPRAFSQVAESAALLPVSRSQDQTSSAKSARFLFPAPAKEECCVYTLPPHN